MAKASIVARSRLRPRRRFRRASGFGRSARQIPADGILAYDVGAHTHQIATQWRTDVPRTLLVDQRLVVDGLRHAGGLRGEAGSSRAHRRCDRRRRLLSDDGRRAVAGAALESWPCRSIVLNDGWLGLMKVKQERKNYPLSGVRLGAPPESPAHYFGVPCRPAKNLDEFAPRSIGRSPSTAQASSKRSSMPKLTLRRFSIEPHGSR